MTIVIPSPDIAFVHGPDTENPVPKDTQDVGAFIQSEVDDAIRQHFGGTASS